ncbi:hypothetical protein IFM89_019686 [Coptis chinensis]|uniref:RNase H type-1 domain-containing protein n=1 Tax=Coptis chinensis TaxID=261450 RepID=A0A835HNQ6_9MAGN|nr:hypothetical protein IFM89_019686 [Coptis chinensis]
MIEARTKNGQTERNSRRFQKSRCPAKVVKDKLIRDLKLYLQAQLTIVADSDHTRLLTQRLGLNISFSNKVDVNCACIQPDPDTVKLNTDGSLTASSAGIGGAIRDHEGNVLLAFNGNSSTKCFIRTYGNQKRLGRLFRDQLQEGGSGVRFHACCAEY